MTEKEKADVLRKFRDDLGTNYTLEGLYILHLLDRKIRKLDSPDERIGRRCKLWNFEEEPENIYLTGIVESIEHHDNYIRPWFRVRASNGFIYYENAKLLKEEDL